MKASSSSDDETSGIAVPEPDDDARLNLIDAVQREMLRTPHHTK